VSVGAWVCRKRDRPIAEGERRTAMAAVVALLTATALLSALARPGVQPPRSPNRAASSTPRSASAVQMPASQAGSAPLTPVLARAAGLFLAGYLGYLYGHAPASEIKGATTALLGSLEAHPPRVPPGMRSRRAHLLSMHATPAASGLAGVSALVNDGGAVDYPIGLLLERQGGRLLVSGLDGE
jgi:hypothetical protein